MRTRTGAQPSKTTPDQQPVAEQPPPPPLPDTSNDTTPIQRPRRRRSAAVDVDDAHEQQVATMPTDPPSPPAVKPRPADMPSAEIEADVMGVPPDQVRPSAKDLSMGMGFDTIVESVFEQDPEADYKQIMQSLVLDTKPSRAEYGFLVDALDQAEDRAQKALKLVANANLARKRMEAEADTIEAAMRNETVEFLKKTKEGRQTLEDIKNAMIERYHDEWRELVERRTKAQQVVNYLEGMVKVVQERARDLRQMVAGARH